MTLRDAQEQVRINAMRNFASSERLGFSVNIIVGPEAQ